MPNDDQQTRDESDFSVEAEAVENRLRAAADVRQQARQVSEASLLLVHGRLQRTAAFAPCQFMLKGKSISVTRAGNVIAVITNTGGETYDLSRPGAGKIADGLSMSGLGEAIAELIFANEASRATAV